MTDSAPKQAAPRSDALGGTIENDDRFFLERVRLGLWLINAGIAFVFVGWIVIHPGERPLLSFIQALNFLIVAASLSVLRDPLRRTFNYVVGFGAYAVTIVAAGAVGIIANDATTALLILVGIAVIASVLVPWRPVLHLTAMALTIVVSMWTVVALEPPPLLWLRNLGGILPTLIAAIYLSRTLSRQRAEAGRAVRERQVREASLHEANLRLEREIEEHRKTETALRFTMRELDHRVKNTLATVQSVAEQTLRASTSMGDFREAFAGRLQALARIHTALAGQRWEGLTLGALVDLVVGPYCHHPDRLYVDGSDNLVPAELVRVLGMALHELATNAAKYGALSNDAGRVAISARVEGGDGPRLQIEWKENGGPPVGHPARRSFGTRLIEEALAYETQGRVALHFADGGVCCDIDLPIPVAT